MGLKETSKYMSLILRHKPETIGITLDEHGWANVDELIAGIAKTHKIDMDIQAAKESAEKLKGKKVIIKAKAGSNDRLFGSVTSGNVADAVSEQLGVKLDKKKITLSTDIKNFGSYTAAIKLYNGISETIDVEVVEG